MWYNTKYLPANEVIFIGIFRRLFPKNGEREYLLSRGMKIGNNCHIYSWGTLDHTYPHLLCIGDDVTISTNVTILVHDASPNVVGGGTKLERVTIGNNVFIGTGSIVLCGVQIGNDVVIGAGSLVNRDLPSGGVYAGRPARRICTIEEYRQKIHALRQQRPDLGKIRPWDQWENAPQSDRDQMLALLSDGCGFI